MKRSIAGEIDATTDDDEMGFAPSPRPAAGRTEMAEFSDDGDAFPLAAGGSASTSAGSSSPVASIATLADWLVNGFWTNQRALPHHWASNTITYNLGNLNAQEQALALSALKAWHEVANINFVQTSGVANINFNHNGTMQAVTSASWNGSGLMTSTTVDISADWVTTDGGANDGKSGIDSYAYQTYVHEIGHALGLGHQGPYNGSASYSVNAIYANDTWQYSVMSYFSENNYSGSSYRYVITPQVADIYAVQSIYGLQTNTRTGDTVYGFNNTAGSPFDFTAYTQAPALTIYDSGGNDTLDCSGYSNNQTIDLHAGSFSSVGGLKNNIGIALGVNIEKAIGGSGNDTLLANDNGCTLVGGGGVDTLIGGAGKDTMTGNAGADNFVFNSGGSSPASGQHDLITDFTSGDHIDLSAMGTFHFLVTTAFDGSTFAVDYVYNSSTGITTVLGDINGDKVADFAIDLTGNIALSASSFVGVQPALVVIESFGATSLVQVGTNYNLNPVGGGTGPVLKISGAAVLAGQYPGWAPIAAEKTISGYDVAWKNPTTGQFSLWATDNNGNYVSNLVGQVPGTDTTLESLETTFQQDLNGDGTIGVPSASTVIESYGVTSLVQVGTNYNLNPFGGGTGLVLKISGAAVLAGQYPGWAPIAAEKTISGYDVAWNNPTTGQFSVWATDNNGNYVSNLVGQVPGTDTTLESLETTFQQDLNGDGTIGVTSASTVIESYGVTSLVQVGTNYNLNPVGGGTGPVLKISGAAVLAGQYPGWAPIAAEKTSSGYDVAWNNPTTGQFSVWATDNNGNYVSNLVGQVLGTDTTLGSLETTFQQDLNGDGTIGVPSSNSPVAASGIEGFTSNFSIGAGGSPDTFLFASHSEIGVVGNGEPSSLGLEDLLLVHADYLRDLVSEQSASPDSNSTLSGRFAILDLGHNGGAVDDHHAPVQLPGQFLIH